MASLQFDDLLRQRQAQAGAFEAPGGAGVQLLELGEEPAHVLGLDADAGVAHLHFELARFDAARADVHLAAVIGELDRVGKQVVEHLLELLLVERDGVESGADLDADGDALLLRRRP